ncbi:MAG: hypothetical protein KAI70_06265 [Candidatus Omnitrophica bacterium]|nr:hypothetical protein [Candidatus Omnitrophota bacterium]
MSRNLSLILIFALCILGNAFVIGASAFSGISALGRNPSAAPKIFTAMAIVLIFAEAVAIIGLLIVYQLFSSS